jgi:hypothetical protein
MCVGVALTAWLQIFPKEHWPRYREGPLWAIDGQTRTYSFGGLNTSLPNVIANLLETEMAKKKINHGAQGELKDTKRDTSQTQSIVKSTSIRTRRVSEYRGDPDPLPDSHHVHKFD